MSRLQSIFDKWEVANSPYLKKCGGKTLAVTYSGGKDSSVTLYMLNKTRDRYGFVIQAYLYAFPVHRYTGESLKVLKEYWREEGVTVNSYFPDADDSILEGVENPCRVCQNLRKKQLLTLFDMYKDRVEDLVIVSGHSLWDLAGYAVNRMVASELSTTSDTAVSRESSSRERFLEVSQRFYPFFKMPGAYYVYRPMLFLNKDEIEDVLKEERIPVLDKPCKYSELRPKKVLSYYFEKFGYNFSYDNVIKFARERLNIPDISRFQEMSNKEFLANKI